MAILNYTTSIQAEKTVMEIQKMLARAKAKTIVSEYDDNCIISHLSFQVTTPYTTVNFRLPANIQGVYKLLKNDSKVPKRLKTKEQAARVAWRIIKDWVKAQLAIVDAQMADMAEVFLPYVRDDSGNTLYEKIKGSAFKQLVHPEINSDKKIF